MDDWYFGINEARTRRVHTDVELEWLRLRVKELEEENGRLRRLVMDTVDRFIKALL